MRVPVATTVGLTYRPPAPPGGGAVPPPAPVTNAQTLRTALIQQLCANPSAGVDLGNNGDLFQFMPSYMRDEKLERLLTTYGWLRSSRVLGAGAYAWPANFVPDDLANWPDVVDYCQVVQITRANAAVGPVNCGHYFNG